MLIWYYGTLGIIAIIMIMIGQGVWALIPGIFMVIVATGSIQSRQSSIKSVQQFATDNIMLLSRLVLMCAVIRLMYVAGYDVIISTMIISLVTIIMYYMALSTNFSDGIIVWHQSSLAGICMIGIALLLNITSSQISLGLSIGVMTIYMVIIAMTITAYLLIANSLQGRLLPETLYDEAIFIWAIIVPIGTIITVFSKDLIGACTISLVRYAGCMWGLKYLENNHSPIYNTQELTLDLILKGYKTTYINSLTNRSWLSTLVEYIHRITDPIRTIIIRLPDIIIGGAYLYFIIQLVWRGISLIEFIIYCIGVVVYGSLTYITKLNSITIDTIAQSFVIGYLTIIALMMTVFTSDMVTGSIVGVIWVIGNALIVTQYKRLGMDQYLLPLHVQRRVRANTVGAIVVMGVVIQLPIDTIMIIPILLIILAILGFTIAQSYATLRSIK